MILLLIIVVILFVAISSDSEQTHTYNAKFGDSGEILSGSNDGFAIGNKALTSKMSFENLLLAAPTSSGKTTGVIIPSCHFLAKAKHTTIIFDVSRQVIKTWKSFEKNRFSKWVFDPSNSKRSLCFNPISYCKTIADINKLSQILIQNSGTTGKGDPFWESSSIMIISLMIRYLVFHADSKYATFQNVLRLIDKLAAGNEVDKLFIKIKAKDEQLFDSYKAVLKMGEKTLQSVIATARTALQIFSEPEVCKVTAKNTMDFNLLREKPIVFFVMCPLKDTKYYKPLMCLLFQCLFDFVLSEVPADNARPIFFLLEEFSSMKFPDIGLTVSNIRKHRSGLLLCIQEEAALVAQYGPFEAQQIKTNTTKVYLKGQTLTVAKELSQLMGIYSLVNEQGKEIGTRSLMMPEEIRQSGDAFIVASNKPIYRVPVVPYYDDFWLKGLMTNEPYPFSEEEISDPPLIPIM